jgi:hypothetical protein
LPLSRTYRLCCLLLALAAVPASAQKKSVAPFPLAAFAGQRVLVLPVQFLLSDTGAIVTPAGWGAFRKELDDSIGAEIAGRGIGKGWGYAADVVRSSKRNALYSGDPYALGAQQLRGVVPKPEDKIPQVLAGNIRTIIALGDARYVLLPIEVRVEKKGALQRAVLRLTLIDGRLGQYVWLGDVASEAATALTPVIVGSLAARVADLVLAP